MTAAIVVAVVEKFVGVVLSMHTTNLRHQAQFIGVRVKDISLFINTASAVAHKALLQLLMVLLLLLFFSCQRWRGWFVAVNDIFTSAEDDH